jgi:hypothetical protein
MLHIDVKFIFKGNFGSKFTKMKDKGTQVMNDVSKEKCLMKESKIP